MADDWTEERLDAALAHLEAQGLISIIVDPETGEHWYWLTAKGRRVYEETFGHPPVPPRDTA